MDQSEIETEPSKQIPTLVWMVLGALVVGAFAAAVIILRGPPTVVGPAPAPIVAAQPPTTGP